MGLYTCVSCKYGAAVYFLEKMDRKKLMEREDKLKENKQRKV